MKTKEQELIEAGRPIERAFVSLLEAAYKGAGMSEAETMQCRQLFFAGARAALAYCNGGTSARDDANRTVQSWAELDAFLTSHIANLRTDGNA